MIDATSGATSSSAITSAATSGNKPLDREAFLNLLLTQLKNQDPLKPMADTEFISQLAQFSSLEQMTSMNSTMEQFAQSQTAFEALGLVSKTIQIVDPDDTTKLLLTKVDSVKLDSGTPYLKVSGYDGEIPISYVQNVFQDQNTAYNSLIGQTVQVKDPSNENNVITGLVEKITYQSDTAYIKLKDRSDSIPVSSLVSISAEADTES